MLKLEYQTWLQHAPADLAHSANPLEEANDRPGGAQLLEHPSLGMNLETPAFGTERVLPFNALGAGRWAEFMISGQNTEAYRVAKA